MTAPTPDADPIWDQYFAVRQMRDTARYIDQHGKAPDDLAEFLRHWAFVVTQSVTTERARAVRAERDRDDAYQMIRSLTGGAA